MSIFCDSRIIMLVRLWLREDGMLEGEEGRSVI